MMQWNKIISTIKFWNQACADSAASNLRYPTPSCGTVPPLAILCTSVRYCAHAKTQISMAIWGGARAPPQIAMASAGYVNLHFLGKRRSR